MLKLRYWLSAELIHLAIRLIPNKDVQVFMADRISKAAEELSGVVNET